MTKPSDPTEDARTVLLTQRVEQARLAREGLLEVVGHVQDAGDSHLAALLMQLNYLFDGLRLRTAHELAQHEADLKTKEQS